MTQTTGSDHPPGFYWVRFRDEPEETIGKWVPDDSYAPWWLISDDVGRFHDEVTVLDEKPIVRDSVPMTQTAPPDDVRALMLGDIPAQKALGGLVDLIKRRDAEIERLRRVEVEFKAYRERMLAAAPYPFCRHPEKCIPTGRCQSDWVCND